MIRCRITCDRASYTGLFSSTVAAVMDAMDRFPAATRISVRAIP